MALLVSVKLEAAALRKTERATRHSKKESIWCGQFRECDSGITFT